MESDIIPNQSIREAQFWHKLDGDVQCELCNQMCRIRPGKRGLCGVRENREGTLMTLVYGNLIASNVDPIEKKPLFHFLPGSLSYSIATAGCNFRCLHCQNADISQLPRETGQVPGSFVPPEEVVAEAVAYKCRSISYTYTEPTIFLEYAYDVAMLAKDGGLKNVFVSNGYIGKEAGELIIPVLDAINIDLKGDDQFYRKVCGAKLEPVKHNIKRFWDSGVWVEVTTLIIPGYNDSEETLQEIASFLTEVSPEIPWHVTAFYPTYKLRDAPPTNAEQLRKGVEIGRRAGLKYVYAGNIPGEDENTRCPSCGEVLVERLGFRVLRNSVVKDLCPKCGSRVAGVWH
jgi:pyruvate formate lyase activating enzyme